MAGLRLDRLDRLVDTALQRCRLDLTGCNVVTEAATGAYVVTAVLAAAAGAHVTAIAGTTRHGTADEARAWTERAVRAVQPRGSVQIVEQLDRDVLAEADIVTNTGHVRPLDAALVAQLKPTAVVPLMMEAWEVEAGRADVDLAALRRRGIAFAGTNERHPPVGVFEYLGVMAVKLLIDAGVPVHDNDLVLLCDNPFRPYLERTLETCGAAVTALSSPELLAHVTSADAVVLAMTPAARPRLAREHLELLAERFPGTVVAQFFGDIDHAAAHELGVPCWPQPAPPPGHMGVLPSDIGPDPIVRLQAGGLKVGQVLLTPDHERTDFERGFLDVL